MSEINYFQIEEDFVTMLKSNATLMELNPTIEIEDDSNLIAEKCPYVGIFLDSWESPYLEEKIGGSTPFTTYLTFEIWLYEFAFENKQGAILRDKLLQKVKEAIKQDRKLNNSVLISRFEGGDFDNSRNSEGFFKGVSIKLRAEVRE